MMTVAQTILSQLGGKRFQVMTGATNFLGTADTLRFTLPSNAKDGIDIVSIRLDASDTYTVRFLSRSRSQQNEATLISESTDVYVADLEELFTTATGLYTRLR